MLTFGRLGTVIAFDLSRPPMLTRYHWSRDDHKLFDHYDVGYGDWDDRRAARKPANPDWIALALAVLFTGFLVVSNAYQAPEGRLAFGPVAQVNDDD